MANYLPILIYLIAVVGFAAVSLFLPHIVAPRKRTRVKGAPYESGMDPVGDARKPFDIRFSCTSILRHKRMVDPNWAETAKTFHRSLE